MWGLMHVMPYNAVTGRYKPICSPAKTDEYNK